MNFRKEKYITVLDIGASKICGLMVKVTPQISENIQYQNATPKLSIMTSSAVPSQGIIGGEIKDVRLVEKAISILIENLETKSNQRIDTVWINASTGSPNTEYKDLETEIANYISEDHIRDLQNQVVDALRNENKYIMHAIPVGYEVDGAHVKQPIGMKGQKLKAQMVLITGKLSQLRNLGISVERAHVEISGRVVTPIASALGCLDQSEKDNGAICIDIGAETISLCAFNKGVPVYVDVLKMGSNYITKDVARAFSISIENAEIIKKNHGSCVPNINDDKITLELPIIGADYDVTGFETRPKSHLTQIIQPRCEEMFELIRDHLAKLGILHPSYRLVLTGGGSELDGIETIAAEKFGMRPRIAGPSLSVTLPQDVSGAAHTTLIGLLKYALNGLDELPPHQIFSKLRFKKGFTGKFLNWFVQNF